MRGVELPRAALDATDLTHLVLTSDLRDDAGHLALAKGTRLAHERHTLARVAWSTLHLVALEHGDVDEGSAGQRLARAVAGAGIEPGEAAGGQWPLRATHRGILRVDSAVLARLNAHEDLGVYTLFDGQVVDAGEVVARAKIIPFAVAEATIAAGEACVREGGAPIRLDGFRACRVVAIVQESLGTRAVQKFRDTFGEKVTWFGGTLLPPVFVEPDAGALAAALREASIAGPDLVVVAGSRVMDPLDPLFAALAATGARMVRRGMPAHPGSLCWVAERDGVPIVGMPSCGVFSQATVFDLLLTRVFAGLPLTSEALALFGHGGFLGRDMAFRFPPYRQARERGEVE